MTNNRKRQTHKPAIEWLSSVGDEVEKQLCIVAASEPWVKSSETEVNPHEQVLPTDVSMLVQMTVRRD